MILGFKTKFPWGGETHFKEKILQLPGFTPKQTSIREGERWAPGMKIQFATGVRTKNYECFKEDTCKYAQKIEITKLSKTYFALKIGYRLIYQGDRSLLGDNDLQYTITHIAINDGFENASDFFKFFNLVYFQKNQTVFEGQIIHWTNLRY